MEPSIIQKYKFREHLGGAMVGGFSLQNIISTNQLAEGAAQLEGFSVPVGLYISDTNNGVMLGGAPPAKTIIGGTLDNDRFDKLYGAVTKHVVKASKTRKARAGR